MYKLIIFLFFITKSIFPQTNTILKSNLTDIIVGRYSIGLETKIRDSFSLGLDIDVINKSVYLESNLPWYPFTSANKQGIIFEPQIRWYNFKKDITGLYTSISGFLGFANYNSAGIENNDWSSLGTSLHLGYQIAVNNIIFDSYFGGTYADDNYPGPYYESTVLFPAPSGFRLSGGIKLGFILTN